MLKLNYLQKPDLLPLSYDLNNPNARTWVITEDIEVVLSDGRILIIEKGFETDLASVPKILWSIYTPFDEGLLGDIIHDKLWIDRVSEIKHFKDVSPARKFADKERVLWRNAHAPRKKTKTLITNFVIRIIGGFYYSGQIEIPN